MFPTNAVLDNFNRAGTTSPPSASWTEGLSSSALLALSGDSATVQGNGGDGSNVWDAIVTADSEVYVTLASAMSGSVSADLLARVSGASGNKDCYFFSSSRFGQPVGRGELFRFNGGSATSLGNVTLPSTSSGASLGMTVSGTATVAISIYHKPSAGSWSLVTTISDSSASRVTAAGKIGLSCEGGGKADDFGGGVYTPPVAANTGAFFAFF